jgi:hypothetical protein
VSTLCVCIYICVCASMCECICVYVCECYMHLNTFHTLPTDETGEERMQQQVQRSSLKSNMPTKVKRTTSSKFPKVRVALADSDDEDNRVVAPSPRPQERVLAQTRTILCERCEEEVAVQVCHDKPCRGIPMCGTCIKLLHKSAKKKTHNIQDLP